MQIKSLIGSFRNFGNEFKTFVLKGNVVDLAVGVVIGAGFGKVVDSVVKDLITPLIGLIGGTPDFSSIAIGAHEVVKNGQIVLGTNGRPLLEGGIMIGNFLNTVLSFLILAAVVFFLVVKPMNALAHLARLGIGSKDAPPPPMPDDVRLLGEIRDLLKGQHPAILPGTSQAAPTTGIVTPEGAPLQ